MSRIAEVFKDKKHKALIAYITVGYPDIEATLNVAALLAESGCDIIELGIPFSDPMADGLTIQHASYQALLNGVHLNNCFETARKIRGRTNAPLVFMTYLNPILSYGTDKFCRDCAAAGVDGLIVPDLPPGELPEFDSAARKYGVDTIYFIAPNSSEERIRKVAQASSGFIYIISVTGVTGVRNSLSSDLGAVISQVRRFTDKPLCIGFGISGAAQAAEAAKLADGVIIGSRIIQLMEEDNHQYEKLRHFIGEIRNTIDKPDGKIRTLK